MLSIAPLTNRLTKTVLLAALMGAAALLSARADHIVFDPDGGGNSDELSIGAFQFGAGNTLAKGAVPFTQGANFQLLMQGQLNSIVTTTGAQLTPVGLNATGSVSGVNPYEITVVVSATETVGKVLNGQFKWELAATQAAGSFVEMYYDPNQNANPLAGTGYNDGLVILKATPTGARPSVGSYAVSNPQPSPAKNFDSFGANDYATAGAGGSNITSLLGASSNKIDAVVTYVDATFFVTPGGGDVGRKVAVGDVITFDLGQATPFDKVQPSHLFVGTANSGTGNGPAPNVTPSVGAVNGSIGPDVQLQNIAAAEITSAPSPTPTATPSASPTATPTATPSATPTATPTATPSATPTATPSATPTPSPVVGITSDKDSVKEGHDAVFTFSVTPTAHPALTVNYTTGGTATLNTDYTLTGTAGQVIIPLNQPSATITLHAITDTVKEPNGETARIFLGAGAGYTIAAPPGDKKGVTILDP